MPWTDHDIEIAWAAGFFDGEGSIGATTDHRGGRRVSVQMSVAQSGPEDEPPASLVRFQKAVGVGKVYKRHTTGGRLGSRPMWYWRASNVEDCKTTVALLVPHITEKIDQIARAVAQRSEWEGLYSDRRIFCKRGHDLRVSAYPNNLRANCRDCNRERMADWRGARREVGE